MDRDRISGLPGDDWRKKRSRYFREPELSGAKQDMAKANEAVDGFFPAVARYLKKLKSGANR